MQRIFSHKTTGNMLLVLLALLAGFHLLAVIGIVPPEIVWGGRTVSGELDFTTMELMALIVTLLMAAVVAMRVGYFGAGRFPRTGRVGCLVIGIYFLLNALGNLASPSEIEKAVFTPLAIIMALLSFRLAATGQPDSGYDS